VQKVLDATQNEPPEVKQAALQATSVAGATSETVTDRAAAVERILDATQQESPEVKHAALQVAAAVPGPPERVVGWLWKVLLVGLLLLIAVSLVGVLWAVLDGNNKTDSDKALILFTTLVSGLFGLFVTSPTEKGTGTRSQG
jgi:hypothetical protein